MSAQIFEFPTASRDALARWLTEGRRTLEECGADPALASAVTEGMEVVLRKMPPPVKATWHTPEERAQLEAVFAWCESLRDALLSSHLFLLIEHHKQFHDQ